MLRILAVIASLAAPSLAYAACVAPPAPPDESGIRYFFGIQPSDGVLDVWCRLQANLKGDYRVNLLFTGVGANRTFELKFDGRPTRPKSDFAEMLQSLLPTKTGTSFKDDKGQEFSKVLKHVVQPIAPQTDDGQPMGMPPEIKQAHDVYLWEPFAIRVKPLKLAGADFRLTVLFKPAVGRVFQTMESQTDMLVLKGATERVLPGVVKSGTQSQCPQTTVPDCLPFVNVADGVESMPVGTAWIVEAVILDADEGRLSPATDRIFGMLAGENSQYVTNNTMDRFTVTEGEAELEASDETRVVMAKATADPNHSLGTSTIHIVWTEKNNNKSYPSRLSSWAKGERDSWVTQYSRH